MCVDRLIFFGEDSLRYAVREMEIYYNRERAHQALKNRIIKPFAEEQPDEGVIDCRSRLGGLMNYYYGRLRSTTYSSFGTLRRGDRPEIRREV